jgi:hypothetical protein
MPDALSNVTTTFDAKSSLTRLLLAVKRISSESIIVERTQPSGCGIFITGSSLFLPGIVVKGTSTASHCDASDAAAVDRSAPATARASSTYRVHEDIRTVAIASRTMTDLDLVTMVCNLVGRTPLGAGLSRP